MAKKKAPLKQKAIDKKLKDLSEWKLNKNSTQLSRTLNFPSFINGLAFAAKITVHAEVMGHHPTIELSYGKVKITLTTHDVKGLTAKDFELAKRIDGLRLS